MIKLKSLITEVKNNSKTVVIVHGWNGSPNKDWIPSVSSELKKLGYNVICPSMPDSEKPVISKWVNKLSEIMPDTDNILLVGHSIGCQAIMRYLELSDRKFRGMIFVAGFFDLPLYDRYYNDCDKKIAAPWIETSIDLKKVKKNIGFSTVILSSNDPYVPYKKTKEQFEKYLESTIVTVDSAGHFDSEDDCDEFPELISIINKK